MNKKSLRVRLLVIAALLAIFRTAISASAAEALLLQDTYVDNGTGGPFAAQASASNIIGLATFIIATNLAPLGSG